MKKNLDVANYIVEVIETLQDHGFEAYIVGGAVRDLLLGRSPKDYDITTDAEPEEIKKAFRGRRAMIIGRRFRLVHLYHGHEIIEISTFRRDPQQRKAVDNEPPHFRRRKRELDAPENMIFHDNEYGSVEEDAFRRDFTVNSLFYDPVELEMLDFTGQGLNDIESGIVRCIGDPCLRFEEDPVRMLRALKLVGQYGFELEENTLRCLRDSLELIVHASPSRLTLELEKILKSPYGDKILRSFARYDFLQYILPFLARHWGSREAEYALKLLAERNRHVAEGRYRDSISMAMSSLVLPFAEKALGEYGKLWDYDDSTVVTIRRCILDFFAPHSLIKSLTASTLRTLLIQTAFFKRKDVFKMRGDRAYGHGRELLLIQNAVLWHDAELEKKWPPGMVRGEKNSKRPRRRRRASK